MSNEIVGFLFYGLAVLMLIISLVSFVLWRKGSESNVKMRTYQCFAIGCLIYGLVNVVMGYIFYQGTIINISF